MLYNKRFLRFNIALPIILVALTLFVKQQFLANAVVSPNISKPDVSKKSESEIISNEILVKVKKDRSNIKGGNPLDTGNIRLNKLHKEIGVTQFENITKHGKKQESSSELDLWYKVELPIKAKKISATFDRKNGSITTSDPSGQLLNKIMAAYLRNPDVETIEPNFIITTHTLPNDPYYLSSGSWGQNYLDLWGMKKISLESVWNSSTGSASVVIADIDTGVYRNHEDLSNNMWVNTAEIPNNSMDDDGNGYVDDYYGWDFVNNDSDPMDDNGHGTHTAGTIAGVGNNGMGVVGVNWTSKIMAVKFLNNAGNGSMDAGARALRYAADMGAKVSSNSWGCSCQSQLVDDAVTYAHNKGMVVVVAAGNDGTDALDASPASSDMAITVGATDPSDQRASFSNYGEKIDVTAPGVDILSLKASVSPICTASLTVGAKYCRLSGTSMATPHVAGLSGLLLSMNPTATNEQIRQMLRLGSEDILPFGKDKDFGYGRINASRSASLLEKNPLAPLITAPSSRNIIFGTVSITGVANGATFSNYKVELGAGRNPSAWQTIISSTTPVSNGQLALLDTTQYSDGKYIIRLTVTDTSGLKYQFQVNDVEIDNFDASISSPLIVASKGQVDVLGSAQTKNGNAFANYKLEWGFGSNPATWSTSGVTLVNSGTQAVTNGKLGEWDTSALSANQSYTLRLTVTAQNNANTKVAATITIDKDLVSGWPKSIDLAGCPSSDVFGCQASSAMADLDGDAQKEIIIIGGSNKIYAYRKNGSTIPGFPFSGINGDYFKWSPNVVDIDNDGTKEIVASAVTVNNKPRIYIVKSDGSQYPGWPMQELQDTNAGFNDHTPTIVDLDNDGNKDIIALDQRVLHVYHVDGTEAAGFPKNLPIINSYIQPVVAVADIDNDEKLEIAVGNYDKLYLFDYQGNIVPGWPYQAPLYNGRTALFQNTIAFGDIDGDGQKEVIAYIDPYNSLGDYALLYAFKKNGSLLSGWPQQAGRNYHIGGALQGPGVIDIDRDGKDEVIVGLCPITIHDDTAAKAINFLCSSSSPALSDVNGDGKIKISASGSFIGLANEDGTFYWQSPATFTYGFSTYPVISDLDMNGKMELSSVGAATTSSASSLRLYLWEIPGQANSTLDWPLFMHDSAHTGFSNLPLFVSPTPTLTSTPTQTPTPTATQTPTPTTTPTPVPDTTAPTVSITNPKNNTTVTKNTTITISATASDNKGVTKVEFYVNGTIKCTDTAPAYSCNWTVPTKPNVSYTLQAIAYDAANNSSSQSIKVTSK